MKIACASTNGIEVNEHFGTASEFYIFTLEGGELKRQGVVKVKPYSSGDQKDHPFAQNAFERVYVGRSAKHQRGRCEKSASNLLSMREISAPSHSSRYRGPHMVMANASTVPTLVLPPDRAAGPRSFTMTQLTGPDNIVNELLVFDLGKIGAADMLAHGEFPFPRRIL